ncbi:hypothetical protein HDG34_007929 [Paraburkholderia sp. HC6.4b]|nr:hypothetical protein [Paraburkholderia sp. HC6.4b]MBB5456344.1 hypothetical protein [Paraburkholderia sp. Kb1A]
MRISGVVEALFAEFGDEPIALVARAQIDVAIGSEGLVEQTQVIGNRVREALMARGGEDKAAPGGAFLLEPFQHLLVIGQHRHVDIGRLSETGLEPWLAKAHQPKQRLIKTMRRGLEKRKDGFDQNVGAHQRSIEIDYEGLLAHLNGLEFRKM